MQMHTYIQMHAPAISSSPGVKCRASGFRCQWVWGIYWVAGVGWWVWYEVPVPAGAEMGMLPPAAVIAPKLLLPPTDEEEPAAAADSRAAWAAAAAEAVEGAEGSIRCLYEPPCIME